jgi:hypothetical protein
LPRLGVSLIAGKSSAFCALPHSAPLSLNNAQGAVFSVEEIAVRTPEGIHVWTENLDIENGITAGSSAGIAPALNDKLGL